MSRSRIISGMLSLCLAGQVAAQAMAVDLSAATLVEKGVLTFGVAATFAPFEYQKDGKRYRYDISEAKLRELGPSNTNAPAGTNAPASTNK